LFSKNALLTAAPFLLLAGADPLLKDFLCMKSTDYNQIMCAAYRSQLSDNRFKEYIPSRPEISLGILWFFD